MILDPAELARRLLQLLPDPVMVADRRGRVVAASEAARRVLGYHADDLAGRLGVVDLYHRREDIRRVADRARRGGGGAPVDALLRTRGGEVVPVWCHPALLRDAGGRAMGTIGVYVDRRPELDRERRVAELERELAGAEARLQAGERFGALYHEIAQPLTVALGQTELALMADGAAPAVVERLERIHDQLERMRALVHDHGARAGGAGG